MRRTRVVEGKRHRILASLAVVEFALALASLKTSSGLSALFFMQGLFFVLFDRMGVPAVEVNANGSLYRIYPNWSFSALIVDGEDRRTVPLIPGRSTVEINGEEITLDVKPGRLFPTVFVEFKGERLKLF
ncbi:hypothetical protein A3L11_04575 [Thermococcus siculi]|uniref:Uncharacterized protein n=1 Tax=Thermococcus siculi TaxID=72803 RepID=A0A2Z2MRY3_9EURY|nr:hypothetical protein [Thermococcus siculi]ASJ08546.1 hypothetical protein A3L11_04575 [Thermococcus siculi]